ncbi:YaeQ family protein [Psychromonas sp. CD1]|uniref:YaeQ family protein n=1 Tax=Psychromonas sp. CD1 TaxID=1979839 RepID=UPI000B9B1B91|nr:YaeQ family protein [Psychromonas sp. CD1]
MALKPTIYKMSINRSDFNNDIYDAFNFTLAQHPSENLERMMARVVAYCLQYQEFLAFSKGLFSVDDPDIWAKNLSDELLVWIDMGEPAFERIKKASRRAKSVYIYTFNSKSDVWWQQGKKDFSKLKNVEVYQFEFAQIQELALLVQRSMEISMTMSGQTCYIATQKGECEINYVTLQSAQ